MPTVSGPLTIDTATVIAQPTHHDRVFRTVRKVVAAHCPSAGLEPLPPQEEYTFFHEDAYVVTHAYTVADSGPKKTEIFLWTGAAASDAHVADAQARTKQLAREHGNAFVHTVRQGFEPPGFVQALGGILITRSGSRKRPAGQFMLRGRQHLGQIVFDEVDFGLAALCRGFAHLVSHPVTLQQRRLYLWKGAASSAQEVSAARLVAMDLAEAGEEPIEVDDGAEFPSFLHVFGPHVTTADLPRDPTGFWHVKAQTPARFATRLFQIHRAEEPSNKTATGMFRNINNMFARRPSADPHPADDAAAALFAAREISPFAPSDLEPEHAYLLDAYGALYVLLGPLLPHQHAQAGPAALLGQTLLFAAEYAVLAASSEERPRVPRGWVVFAGVPAEVKTLFRVWDEGTGLWGTGGLMAGSGEAAARGGEVVVEALEEVLRVTTHRGG